MKKTFFALLACVACSFSPAIFANALTANHMYTDFQQCKIPAGKVGFCDCMKDAMLHNCEEQTGGSCDLASLIPALEEEVKMMGGYSNLCQAQKDAGYPIQDVLLCASQLQSYLINNPANNPRCPLS